MTRVSTWKVILLTVTAAFGLYVLSSQFGGGTVRYLTTIQQVGEWEALAPSKIRRDLSAFCNSGDPTGPDDVCMEITEYITLLAAQYPGEWATAHGGGPNSEAFINRLAWNLHKIDPKFGLNGKRGTLEISEDVITYLNPSVVFTCCPELAGSQAFDVIAGAGGTNPTAVWNEITDEGGVGGRWIAPNPVSGPGPEPPPQEPGTDLKSIITRLSGLEQKVGEVETLANDVAQVQKAQSGTLADVLGQLAAVWRSIPIDCDVSFIGFGLPCRLKVPENVTIGAGQ